MANQNDSAGCCSWPFISGAVLLFFVIRSCTGTTPQRDIAAKEIYSVAVSAARQGFARGGNKRDVSNPNWDIASGRIIPLPTNAYPAPMEDANIFPVPTNDNEFQVTSDFLANDSYGRTHIVADWHVDIRYDPDKDKWVVEYFDGGTRRNGDNTTPY